MQAYSKNSTSTLPFIASVTGSPHEIPESLRSGHIKIMDAWRAPRFEQQSRFTFDITVAFNRMISIDRINGIRNVLWFINLANDIMHNDETHYSAKDRWHFPVIEVNFPNVINENMWIVYIAIAGTKSCVLYITEYNCSDIYQKMSFSQIREIAVDRANAWISPCPNRSSHGKPKIVKLDNSDFRIIISRYLITKTINDGEYLHTEHNTSGAVNSWRSNELSVSTDLIRSNTRSNIVLHNNSISEDFCCNFSSEIDCLLSNEIFDGERSIYRSFKIKINEHSSAKISNCYSAVSDIAAVPFQRDAVAIDTLLCSNINRHMTSARLARNGRKIQTMHGKIENKENVFHLRPAIDRRNAKIASARAHKDEQMDLLLISEKETSSFSLAVFARMLLRPIDRGTYLKATPPEPK